MVRIYINVTHTLATIEQKKVISTIKARLKNPQTNGKERNGLTCTKNSDQNLRQLFILLNDTI